MSLILGSAVTGAGGAAEAGYEIERSLRFNSADSAYLSKSFGTPTSGTTWTLSMWVKLTKIPPAMCLFMAGGGSTNTFMRCTLSQTSATSSELNWRQVTPVGGLDGEKGTSQVFRDPSGWYHFVFVWNTTDGTASDRQQIYVNGTRITAFDANTEPSSSKVSYFNNSSYTHYLGVLNILGLSSYADACMTEINFVDGQALDATSFGEFNSETGVWQPIEYAGTYGSNGFYLNFSDNSNNTAATLGKDYSGNGNNWTPTNFSVTTGSGNDSLVDTPTPYGTDSGAGGEVRGNYCIMSTVDQAYCSITNGGLDVATNNGGYGGAVRGTIAVTSGKWYWETSITSEPFSAGQAPTSGIMSTATPIYPSSSWTCYLYYGYNGNKQSYVNGSYTNASYGSSFTIGDVIGYALDLDAGTLTFYKNGVSQGVAYTGLSGSFAPVVTDPSTGGAVWINFGQRPFAHTAPSGHKALCTTNLPDLDIVKGGEYFNPVLYTGNATTGNTVTGVGFQPDFVWIKGRSNATSNFVHDAVRTVSYRLSTNSTAAEAAGLLSSFDSDGFTISSTGTGVNGSGYTYVAWNWKAGGSGVSNTDGSITSTVSANTTSGFSIVTYTGTGSLGTVGHGLGVTPSMIIIKGRTGTANNWAAYHSSVGNTGQLFLNLTNATDVGSAYWNNTSPTSSVFTINTASSSNTSGYNYVAYCFAPVEGFSAFGSYTGNGSSTDGPFVFCNFRPRWILFKKTSATSNWSILDTARDTYNVADNPLLPNLSNAESTSTSTSGAIADILSNGFKARGNSGDINDSGATYIYAAFAENPFKHALAR